jgi:hypothetical protein
MFKKRQQKQQQTQQQSLFEIKAHLARLGESIIHFYRLVPATYSDFLSRDKNHLDNNNSKNCINNNLNFNIIFM